MTAQLTPLIAPDVIVTAQAVHIHNLSDTDPDLIRAIGDADDAIEAARSCLRIGARALRAASSGVDTDVIERSFNALEQRMQQQVADAETRLAAAATALFDEDAGSLATTLEGFREGLERALGDTFDPDSKTSVLTTIEDLVGERIKKAAADFEKSLRLEGDSPLAQIRREITDHMHKGLEAVQAEVRRVTEHLQITDAVTEEAERGTQKGFVFEDIVERALNDIAGGTHDIAANVGDTTGAAGTKKGDIIVTLNPLDTGGRDQLFVVECKARKLGMAATLRELDQAIDNRNATVALAVFRDGNVAPVTGPLHVIDHRAIVVLESGLEATILRLAYQWARLTTRRCNTERDETLDIERVSELLADAHQALKAASTIKRCHSTIRTQVQNATKEVENLVEQVTDALDGIEQLLQAAE